MPQVVNTAFSGANRKDGSGTAGKVILPETAVGKVMPPGS
jgi:hypothetical protein